MRSLLVIMVLSFSNVISYSQVQPGKFQSGLGAKENLITILKLSPAVTGDGLDARFEGVKGSPRLFENLLPSFLKISGYDEYVTSYWNYIMTSDSIFHLLQLNKKSLIKLFPDKKNLIESAAVSNTAKNDEEMILSILGKFQAP
jgi:hypothetical protein